MVDIISKLKNAGTLLGEWHPSAGSLKDFSGNNRDLTVNGTMNFNKEGITSGFDNAGVNYLTFSLLSTFGTFVWHGKFRNLDNDAIQGLFGYSNATPIMGITSKTNLRVRSATSLAEITTSSLVDDTDYVFVITIESDGTVKAWINGIYQGTNTTANTVFFCDRICIVNDGAAYNFYGTFKNGLITSTILDDTEVAQLSAQLLNSKYPTKPTGKGLISNGVNTSDSDLICALNMKPVDGKVIDETGNGYDGTVGYHVWYGKDVAVGDYMEFKGDNNNAGLSGGSGNGEIIIDNIHTPWQTKTFTMSFWMYNGQTQVDHAFSWKEGNTLYRSGSNSTTYTLLGNTSLTNIDLSDYVGANKWVYLNFVYDKDNTNMKIYANKTLVKDGTYVPYTGSSGENSLGFRYTSGTVADHFIGRISRLEMVERIKPLSEIEEEYDAIVNSSATFKTDWGATESASAESSGYLSNTPFEIDSGTWKISDDTINGQDVKVIECVTAGVCGIHRDNFAENSTEAAYGEVSLWLKKAADSVSRVILAANVLAAYNDGSMNGYMCDINNLESVQIYTLTGGVLQTGVGQRFYSANGYTSEDTWQEWRLPRDTSGLSFYLDGELVTAEGGSNPVTDQTHTTGEYIVFDLDAGDKIAIADKSGGHSIIKRPLP